MRRNRASRRASLGLLVAIAIGALAVPASALSYDETDGAFGPPGSQLVLGTEAVPDEAVGLTCDVIVDLRNNESIRQGSDITVSTGAASRLFPNTEAAAGGAGPVTIQMVMGETLTVTLTFGPNPEFGSDAVFSGSGTVTVGPCVTPPTTPSVDVSPEVVVAPAQATRAASPVVVQPALTG
jgi:hypothetical protein